MIPRLALKRNLLRVSSRARGGVLLSNVKNCKREVNLLSIPPHFCPVFVIGIIECRWKPRKEDAVLWRAVLRRCAWMKFSCSIKSARGAFYYVKALLFICPVVFFSRATKCVYLEFCWEHTELIRGCIIPGFSMWRAIQDSLYFDIFILSRTVVHFPRAHVCFTRIYLRSDIGERTTPYMPRANNVEAEVETGGQRGYYKDK